MSDNNKTTTTGIGFSGMLTIVFIALKLCGVINWSWFWVLSPIIISTCIVIFIIIVCAVVDFLFL